jgi:hypothetical protein
MGKISPELPTSSAAPVTLCRFSDGTNRVALMADRF